MILKIKLSHNKPLNGKDEAQLKLFQEQESKKER